MKKFLFAILIVLLIILGVVWYNKRPPVIEIEMPPAQNYQEFQKNATTSPIDFGEESLAVDLNETSSVEILPQMAGLKIDKEINLNIPFTSQAPTANWAQPWQDACEEASLLMVDYYYQNKKLPNAPEVENILKDMVNWQELNWGGHNNLTMDQVAILAQALFNYQSEVIEDLNPDKLRQYLSRGLPVIVPADGHKLNNPFFTGDGPDYHMLVIKGYVGDKFITNDPGTRRGADFVYTEDNLFYSIAEWDNHKLQAVGPKKGLVLYRN